MSFYLDIETTGLNPRRCLIHGIGLLNGKTQERSYITFAEFHRKLASSMLLIGHNLRFDLAFLRAQGLPIYNRWLCTKVLASVVNESYPLHLKELVTHLFPSENNLKRKNELDLVIKENSLKHVGELCSLDLLDPAHKYSSLIGEYCLEDCSNTMKVYQELRSRIYSLKTYLNQLGFKLTPYEYFLEEAMPIEEVLLDMSLRGIRVNLDKVNSLSTFFAGKEEELKSRFLELCSGEISKIEDALYRDEVLKRKSDRGKAQVLPHSEKYGTLFNIDSTHHIGKLFYEYLDFPSVHTKKGHYDTSEYQVASLFRSLKDGTRAKEILHVYREYKKVKKISSTYLGSKFHELIEDGRIYPEWLSAGGTVTGRLASRSPNMQNLPSQFPELKQCFIPSDGCVFLYFDYSQIELRIAAHLSQDEKMLEAYQKNFDIHEQSGAALNVPRSLGKKLNFAMIYGASAYRLKRELPDLSLEECENFRKQFFDFYSGYTNYLQSQIKFLKYYGFTVSMFGRLRRLPSCQNHEAPDFHHAINQGVNFPIQSAAASICKRVMIALHRRGYRIISQVHDAIILEVPIQKLQVAIPEVTQIAENIVKLSVPLKIDIKVLQSLDESDIIKEGSR